MSRVIKTGSGAAKFTKFIFPSEEEYLESIAHEEKKAEALRQKAEADPVDEKAAVQSSQQLLEEAREQAEVIKSQAREQGYAEGLRKAEEEERKELGEVVDSFRQTVRKLAGLQEEIIRESEMEIVELSLDVARKVIGAELYNDPSTVAKVIRSALARVGSSDKLTVRVSPEDYEMLVNSPPDFLGAVELTPDPQVARGGAVLDTPRGRLDAQIEEQLAEIGKSLRKGVVEADGAA